MQKYKTLCHYHTLTLSYTLHKLYSLIAADDKLAWVVNILSLMIRWKFNDVTLMESIHGIVLYNCVYTRSTFTDKVKRNNQKTTTKLCIPVPDSRTVLLNRFHDSCPFIFFLYFSLYTYRWLKLAQNLLPLHNFNVCIHT